MAIGDSLGDVQLTSNARNPKKQTSFDATNLPSQYRSDGATPVAPPGPIASAQQGAATASLADVNMQRPTQPQPSGSSSLADAGQQGVRQTSFDATNTPSQYLPPAGEQAAQPQQSVGLSDAWNKSASGMLSGGAQNPPVQAPLAGLSLLSAGQQPVPSPAPITAPAVAPSATPSLSQMTMPPTPGPMNSDQYRSTGIGAGAQGGAIVGKLGADGVPEFSNAGAAQSQAASLGRISMTPQPGALTQLGSVRSNVGGMGASQESSQRTASLADAGRPPASPSAPSFASLGSVGNMGDGIGVSSQANAGDASLSMARLQKASDLRESYADK
ncbi:MAG: hypothetical protein ACOH2T_28840, partial [Pseudomonas sp.]